MTAAVTVGAVAAGADGWLFGGETAGRVRVTRILLAVLIGGRIALSPFRGLAGQPAALFRPVWFLEWLDRMPSLGTIVAVQVIGAVAAALAVLGWRERGTFLAAWMSLLFLAGLRASRGKVQHNDVLLLLVAAAFVLAPVGLRALDRRRSVAWGWPVRTALVVVAGAYFLSGFQKVVASGPAWVLSDNLRNIMYRAALSGRAPTDQVALFIADRPALAHVVALGALAVELGFLSILFWPRARPWFVAAAAVLHTGIYLTHGLDYWMWIATTAVVLIDWQPLATGLANRATRTTRSPSVSGS
ncbi:MAG: hypothetical protein Q8K58_11135 [Acidimicrobiales bacterium]|nr:hypothetical protein [Acidimicrobiales bacterium]